MKGGAIFRGGRGGETWRRYGRFCLVGGSGVAVDMAAIWLLADPACLGWNLTLSKVIAAEVALVNNFIWNEVWTFRGLGGGGWRGRLGRFGKFNLICAAGIGWSVLLLRAQVAGLGWNVYVANFIAIVLVSGWNFGMNLKFGWKGNGRDEISQLGEPPGAPKFPGATPGGTVGAEKATARREPLPPTGPVSGRQAGEPGRQEPAAPEVTRGSTATASSRSDEPPPDVGGYGGNPPPHVGGYPAAPEVTRGAGRHGAERGWKMAERKT